MVEDREFLAFQEKKTTSYYSMLLCLIKNYILMESPFHAKEFGASFSYLYQSMRELRLYN